MMVANTFDLWQKDTFFSAAEEVQESADIMESAYRRWVKEKREGITSAELCKELQTALGTAKWQLDEFERAVRLSYGHRSDDNRTFRHRQFVAAIEDQISRVESALRESLRKQGKESLQWVTLNEAERDDLAMFLSGTSQTLRTRKDDEYVKLKPCVRSSNRETNHMPKGEELNVSLVCRNSNEMKGSKDVTNADAMHVIQIETEEISGTIDDVISQVDRKAGTRKTFSSPNFGSLRILAPQDDEQKKLMPVSEATPKEKGSKPVFWKQRSGEHSQAKRAMNLSNQILGRLGAFQRHTQSRRHFHISCSMQFALALMLTIFLIVPYVFYST